MAKKIIIAGGGTGGHIFPAIAIANALKKLEGENEILFVGAKGKMEMEKVPQAGYKIRGLDIAGFNRSSLIKNFGLLSTTRSVAFLAYGFPVCQITCKPFFVNSSNPLSIASLIVFAPRLPPTTSTVVFDWSSEKDFTASLR